MAEIVRRFGHPGHWMRESDWRGGDASNVKNRSEFRGFPPPSNGNQWTGVGSPERASRAKRGQRAEGTRHPPTEHPALDPTVSPRPTLFP